MTDVFAEISRLGNLIRQLQGALGGKTIRAGAVSSAGAIQTGTGFTVVRNGAGDYTVTWTRAYAATPVVVPGTGATAAFLTAKLHATTPPTAALFRVAVFATSTNVATDGDFTFIAVG